MNNFNESISTKNQHRRKSGNKNDSIAEEQDRNVNSEEEK